MSVNVGVSQDRAWIEVASFLREVGAKQDRVLGPDALAELIPGIRPYGAARIADVDWVAIHKGLVEEIGVGPIDDALTRLKPVFANDVFVVYGNGLPPLEDALHVEPLRARLNALRGQGERSGSWRPFSPHAWLARASAAMGHAPAGTPARTAVYLGDHTVLTRTVAGLKLYLDSRDVSLTPHLVLDGFWEQWITRAMTAIVRPGMRVVDVGANVGYYATLFASLVGDAGFVHAFEPVPRLHELLFRNMEINGFMARSRCHASAVHARRGKVSFQLFERHLASSSLFATDALAHAYQDRLQTIEVDTISLDEALADDPRVDVLKVDAEGAEPFVLEGAHEILRASPAIHVFLEFAPTFYASTLSPADVLAQIRALGLGIQKVDTDGTIRRTNDKELLAGAWHELYLSR